MIRGLSMPCMLWGHHVPWGYLPQEVFTLVVQSSTANLPIEGSTLYLCLVHNYLSSRYNHHYGLYLDPHLSCKKTFTKHIRFNRFLWTFIYSQFSLKLKYLAVYLGFGESIKVFGFRGFGFWGFIFFDLRRPHKPNP